MDAWAINCPVLIHRDAYFMIIFPLFFRLHSGWSVKTANLNQWKQPEPMSSDEHERILKVIEKADELEKAEMHRVG